MLEMSWRETEAQRAENDACPLKHEVVRLPVSSQKSCFCLFPDLLSVERWEIWWSRSRASQITFFRSKLFSKRLRVSGRLSELQPDFFFWGPCRKSKWVFVLGAEFLKHPGPGGDVCSFSVNCLESRLVETGGKIFLKGIGFNYA